MRKSLQISGLLSTLLLVGGVHGAGLGKLSVQSYLGQPLRAEIELLSVQRDELQAVTARLANAEAFRQYRIDRSESLSTLRFVVDQRANGQPIIRVTSTGPVNDPFLDLLLELNWTSGRLLREYTILLDLPADMRAQAAAAQATVTPPAASKPTMTAAEPVKTPAPPPQQATAPTPSRYGPVRSGETLQGIASKVRPADVSLEQAMVGLFQRNRDAFVGDNMNRLKRGRTLTVPDADQLRAMTPEKATRTVRAHVADWQAYRRQLADQAVQAPPTELPEQPAAGKIAEKPAGKPAAPAGAAQDVLKLSKGAPAGVDAKTLEKLNAMEEELAAKSRSLDEAQQRVTQLENTVRDLQRLMELRAQETAKAPPAPAPAPEAPKVETAPVPPPVAEPTPPVTPPPAPVAKPAPAPLPAPVAADDSSWLKTFITNPIYIGGIIAAILLSVLLWMMMVGNRRKQGLTSFEDSIMTGGEFKHEAVFKTGGTTSTGTPTEGSMLLTDFSRLGLGSIDTHEVDPIAEAEVYMAYGRDAQAEEILKEALGKDPSRHEITLKLLEIYAARKDTVAFETHASELYAALGGQPTSIWLQAADMGRAIDPDNPLYRVTSEMGAPAMPMAAGALAGAAVAKAAVAAPPPAEVAPPLPEPEPEPVSENLIDFEATMLAPQLPAESTALEPEALPEAYPTLEAAEPLPADLDWDSQQQPVAEPENLGEVEEIAAASLPDAATTSLDDFDFGALPVAEPAVEDKLPEFDLGDQAPEEITPTLPELPLEGIDLEMTEPLVERAMGAAAPEVGMDPELWEEVNTKLDLARAYLEMGDKEGAREILQEVLNEGDGNQKGDAGQLMAQCG